MHVWTFLEICQKNSQIGQNYRLSAAFILNISQILKQIKLVKLNLFFIELHDKQCLSQKAMFFF